MWNQVNLWEVIKTIDQHILKYLQIHLAKI